MSEPAADPRLVALSTLLLVEHDVRRAESLKELFYIVANDTHRLTPYRFAFIWEYAASGKPHPVQASNVSELEPNAPMVRWLGKVSEWLAGRGDKKPQVLVQPEAPADLHEGWQEHAAPFALHVPLMAPDGTALGGLLMTSDAPWSDVQSALVERLADAYGHAWWALRPKVTADVMSHFRRHRKRYGIGLAILLLLPVRQYVLVPAEVVPAEPFVVAAPMSGVVAQVDVLPNAAVTAGTVLFSLEDTSLANEVLVARKAYEVAEAEYMKNAQDAFGCDSCRGRVPELLAQAEKARAEAEWAQAQLDRSRVVAPVDGIAVFSDPNDWRGKPVSVGERVMVLSQPDKTRLRISMPIGDAIAIESGTDVVFYLNVNPLDSYDANVVQTSYEATVQSDQSLSYVLMANFEDEPARLGLRGTAKVYGGRAPILFHVLRKPLAWLRRTLGI
ncbi:MAG: efflux RND transporter periplasmic adaptor subunit [Pseudomonadota bacterium]